MKSYGGGSGGGSDGQHSTFLSVIIPIKNEEKNIPLLHAGLSRVLQKQGYSYEIIYVDDGSTDNSFEHLQHLAVLDTHTHIIRFSRNFGQTAAISAGVEQSCGEVLIFMDGDLQNDPIDIPRLLAKLNEGYDVVSGWRKQRQDAKLSRKLPSWLANCLISKVSGTRLHDYGCTLKAYRRKVFEHVRLYGEMHRFIPAYAALAGASIAEIEVLHHPRRFGVSKYGISRTFRVILDLLTLKFLGSFGTKPLYLFGVPGIASLGMGGTLGSTVLLRRAFPPHVRANRNPLLQLAVFCSAFGMQCIMMGLLAELLMRTYHESQGKATYVIRDVLSDAQRNRENGTATMISGPAAERIIDENGTTEKRVAAVRANRETVKPPEARVLMIAPQPFFESRGAPFCVYQHIKALTTLGYAVDLVTYPFGTSVKLPGLRIFRSPSLPFIHSVKPGPSLAKVPLDIALFLTALLRLYRGKYAFIHTHEEGGMMGAALSRLLGCQHLYYMHSDLSQVVASSEFTHNAWLIGRVEAMQRFMIRKADAVIAFYPEIVKFAQALAPNKAIYQILPPAVDEELPPASLSDVERLRRELRLGNGPVLLYTGTLESYQGIDLLIRSVPSILAVHPEASFVIAGGKPNQVQRLQQLAGEWDVTDSLHFVGQRPLEEMPTFMALADILLSPRSKGTHTPLKLYTYLRCGKPILATDILAHTQILTPDIALLVPPTPGGLAQGAIELLNDKQLAELLGTRARQMSEERYSWAAFLEKNRQVYMQVMGPAPTFVGQPARAFAHVH